MRMEQRHGKGPGTVVIGAEQKEKDGEGEHRGQMGAQEGGTDLEGIDQV